MPLLHLNYTWEFDLISGHRTYIWYCINIQRKKCLKFDQNKMPMNCNIYLHTGGLLRKNTHTSPLCDTFIETHIIPLLWDTYILSTLHN